MPADDFSDNDLWVMMSEANAGAEPGRLKGYYICSAITGCGSDFLRAAARKTAMCPFCGRMVDRVLVMDPVEVELQRLLWLDAGVYSSARMDERAGA